MPDSEYKYECPKCGEILEGQGPASLRWAKQNHEYWEHERKEKGLPDLPGAARALAPSPIQKPLYVTVMPQDVAFYDGARLDKRDHLILRALGVLWVPIPKKGLLTEGV